MQHDFILLDRTGSMAGPRWDESISAINGYVKKLANDNVDTGVTLVAFDTPAEKPEFLTLRDRITPKTWADVTSTEAEPRGLTPLNDAIAYVVNKANAGLNGVPYDKLALLIITDGLENASIEYRGRSGQEKVKAMLDDCRKKGWQVQFIGADFANVQQAEDYGSLRSHSVHAGQASMGGVMAAMATKRGLYGSTGQSITWTEAEQEEAKKDKTKQP